MEEQAIEPVFVGDSEMVLRSYDWAQTPLGAIETWSEDLKTAVERQLIELNQPQTALGQPVSRPSPKGTQTALRQTAATDAFRVTLSEALRLLTDADEIQATAARILGESLEASRVIYVEVLPGGDEVIVHKNYTNGVAELAGRYRLEDFGRNLTEDHRAGRSAIVPDVANSVKYSEREKDNYRAIDIAAHLDVPLIKNGRFVALLAVHQATPRKWTELEVRQVEETAERTWAAVERARAEVALRESEARLKLALKTGKLGSWQLDLKTNRLIVSDQCKVNYGFLPEADFTHQALFDRIHPDDRVWVQAAIQQAIEQQTDYDVEYRTVWDDDSLHWALVRGSTVYDGDGTPLHMVGMSLDITDRKQAEAALREGENRLRLALKSAELGTWDFNPITGVLQWDDQCKAMFGLSPEAEINYDLFLAGLHPDDRDRTDQVVQFSLNPESGGEYDIEYRTIGIEDGIERWIAAKGKALFNSAGIAIRFIGTVLNITEKKQAEADREQLLQREQTAREAAETANRIKDEFLAVLSHELRTPLNPILGWSKLLQQGKLDAVKTTTALATIERNAKLQAQLIEDLLDISRILQGKLTLNVFPVHLSLVISAALETVRLAIDAKAIQLHLALDPEVGHILGDAARLQQVVWNLLSNAVKFTPAKGQITIALSSTDSHAQIQVTDTGKGIKPEFLPYVFEHFRQEDGATTRKFGGLGLGLAIARQIVEMHGGQISVDSPGEGKGATFTVQMPLASCSSALPAIEPSSSSSIDLDGVRILVVDDEADSREFIAFVLEQAGAIVTALDSGFEALQAFSQRTPDIILSDIGMPEMDGYMLMRQIRAQSKGKQVPAIALTAYAGEINQQQAIAAGFQNHLSKPVEIEEVVKTISALCNPEGTIKYR